MKDMYTPEIVFSYISNIICCSLHLIYRGSTNANIHAFTHAYIDSYIHVYIHKLYICTRTCMGTYNSYIQTILM